MMLIDILDLNLLEEKVFLELKKRTHMNLIHSFGKILKKSRKLSKCNKIRKVKKIFGKFCIVDF